MTSRDDPAARAGAAPRLLTWRLVAGVYAALLALYVVVLHPWMMGWGATGAEQSMALPGDALAAGPGAYFTRAITINAPPDRVWPWLVQMGQDRAGFYSNDWLENLFGADIHNADRIHPAWQTRQVGDRVPMASRGYLGGGLDDATLTTIRAIEPNRLIADTPGRFVLLPTGGHATRLIVRERYDGNTPGEGVVGVVAGRGIWDPIHFVMVQRMMRGIEERAGGQPLVAPAILLAARAGWALAAIGLLAAFLTRRRESLWVLLPIAAVTPQITSTRDLDAALAGFLAVGITVAGALVFGRGWWPAYALVAAAVALVLLLAPDAYVAFGLMFDLILASAVVAIALRRGGRVRPTRRETRLAAGAPGVRA